MALSPESTSNEERCILDQVDKKQLNARNEANIESNSIVLFSVFLYTIQYAGSRARGACSSHQEPFATKTSCFENLCFAGLPSLDHSNVRYFLLGL